MVVLAGTGAELERFYGPAYFDEPIAYAEPQPRGGDLNAVAALWVTGIGLTLRPLPPGEHTLIVAANNWAFGDFAFTYHITVSSK